MRTQKVPDLFIDVEKLSAYIYILWMEYVLRYGYTLIGWADAICSVFFSSHDFHNKILVFDSIRRRHYDQTYK